MTFCANSLPWGGSCATETCPAHKSRVASERPVTDSGFALTVTWQAMEGEKQCAGFSAKEVANGDG